MKPGMPLLHDLPWFPVCYLEQFKAELFTGCPSSFVDMPSAAEVRKEQGLSQEMGFSLGHCNLFSQGHFGERSQATL